jgi:predicted kinase
MTTGTLHLFCGKMAAGKSTLAARIASETGGMVIREDALTDLLWPGELASLEAYVDRTRRLKAALWPLVSRLLASGSDVVLDFPANTRRQRAGLMDLVTGSGAGHRLHYLDATDATCKARLAARNAGGEHEYCPTEEDFDRFTSHFQPPEPDEGFCVRVWPQDTP